MDLWKFWEGESPQRRKLTLARELMLDHIPSDTEILRSGTVSAQPFVLPLIIAMHANRNDFAKNLYLPDYG